MCVLEPGMRVQEDSIPERSAFVIFSFDQRFPSPLFTPLHPYDQRFISTWQIEHSERYLPIKPNPHYLPSPPSSIIPPISSIYVA